MRIKNFKKIILVFMFFALCFVYAGRAVLAEENCKTYKNYYLMLMPTQYTPTALESLNQTGQAFFQPIDTTEEISYDQVCVSHSKRNTCPASAETISASTFYQKMNIALSKDPVGEPIVYKNNNYEFYATEPEENGNTVVQYFAHLKWRDVTNGGSTVGNGVNVVTTGNGHNGASESEFIDAMFFPTTNVSKASESNALIWTITRLADDNMFPTNDKKVIPFKYDWPGKTYANDDEKNTYVAPAVGLAKYTVCTEGSGNGSNGDPETFTGIIKYLDKVSKKERAPEHNKEYYDGDTEVVASPPVTGCVADKPSVTVKIENKDFKETVWYDCTVKENSQTGTTIFVICMIVGFSCLAYFLYYMFVGRKKATKEVE